MSVERLPSRILAVAARHALQIQGDGGPVTFASGKVAGLEGATTRRPYVVIDEPVLLALEDNNPLAMLEAHPEKRGNAASLGGRRADAWIASLREALALVDTCVPELGAEVRACVDLVVPVGFDAQRHESATYREAPGTLYISLHPEPMTMAEAWIHELSHTKLNLLFELDPVLENASHPLYPSPLRPDPRPLHGVLLAVHAFLAVLRLYERMLDRDHPLSRAAPFRARMSAIHRGNEEGLAILTTHARPTRVGGELLAEMSRWAARFRDRLGVGLRLG
jgi:HEXXH motif-containing protein